MFMQTFGIIDFIVFLGISQGIFLAITIQVIQHKNKAANKILSLILIVASILLLGKFLYAFDTNNEWFFRIALFIDTLIFVFGPLLYTYCRRLIFNENPVYRIHYAYFIPVLGMCIYYIWTLTYSHDELLLMMQQGKLIIPFFIIETSGITFNYYFCYRCYQLIMQYKKGEKDNLSYSQSVLSFLKTILFAATLFFTLWLFSYISSYYLRFYFRYINYKIIWIAFPIFIYIIGFYSLKQPYIFRVPFLKKKTSQNKERVEGKELDTLKKNLEKLMVDEKIYLNHKLTLLGLAKKLNTSPNNISWLLNNIHQCSFYDYINHYRVQEFIKKVEQGEYQKHTLLALSLDSGFNSKSTFNKAFKAEMNETPSNYIKKIRVA